MQTHLAQLADVEARLQQAIRDLRQQQGLVPELAGLHNHQALALLLANGLRAYGWLSDQHNGLLERIAEELPLPRN